MSGQNPKPGQRPQRGRGRPQGGRGRPQGGRAPRECTAEGCDKTESSWHPQEGFLCKLHRSQRGPHLHAAAAHDGPARGGAKTDRRGEGRRHGGGRRESAAARRAREDAEYAARRQREKDEEERATAAATKALTEDPFAQLPESLRADRRRLPEAECALEKLGEELEEFDNHRYALEKPGDEQADRTAQLEAALRRALDLVREVEDHWCRSGYDGYGDAHRHPDCDYEKQADDMEQHFLTQPDEWHPKMVKELISKKQALHFFECRGDAEEELRSRYAALAAEIEALPKRIADAEAAFLATADDQSHVAPAELIRDAFRYGSELYHRTKDALKEQDKRVGSYYSPHTGHGNYITDQEYVGLAESFKHYSYGLGERSADLPPQEFNEKTLLILLGLPEDHWIHTLPPVSARQVVQGMALHSFLPADDPLMVRYLGEYEPDGTFKRKGEIQQHWADEVYHKLYFSQHV